MPRTEIYGTTAEFSIIGAPSEGTIYRFVLPGAPTLVIAKVLPQGNARVFVEGQVNARGASTSVSLEYGTNGVAFPESVPVAVGISGFQTKLVGTTAARLSPGTTYFFRLRAVSSAGTTLTPVQSFSTLAEPVVSIRAATEIAPTSARFNATVNARNFDTTVFFEWGTDGNSFPNAVPGIPSLVTGNAPVNVSVAVAGFPEGSSVYYRLRATNAAGTVTSGVSSFSLVTVTTNAATDVRVAGARMNGIVNTGGQSASVFFEHGSDGVSFPFVTQATPPLVSAAQGVPVTAVIDDLPSATPYYYRVKVILSGVETRGLPVTFTTTINGAPIAIDDLIFHTGQAEFEPLLNDADADFGETASLVIESPLMQGPARGRTVVSEDGKRITFTVLGNSAQDTLQYRAMDVHGKASAPATVQLIYTGPYAGRHQQIKANDGLKNRVSISLDLTQAGTFTGFFTVTDKDGVNESRQNIVGDFRPYGVVERTFSYPQAPSVTTLRLELDPNEPAVKGRLTISDGTSVTSKRRWN